MWFKTSTAYSIILIVAGLAQASPVRFRETMGDLQARDNLALDTSSLTARELEDSIRLTARSNTGGSTPNIATSSQTSNPGHAAIAGATVYYLYEAPTAPADLKHELQVLQSFLAAWNANKPDDPALAPGTSRQTPETPANTKAPPPATRLIVTKLNHKSTHATSSAQAKHLTVYVVTAAGWALTPHEYGAVVHVFPKNEVPAQGYEGYWMYSKSRQKLNSAAIQAALAAAEAHNFGTLGQGNLA